MYQSLPKVNEDTEASMEKQINQSQGWVTDHVGYVADHVTGGCKKIFEKIKISIVKKLDLINIHYNDL